MNIPIPNLFIVGAPKCGTTSLYAYLGAHPQIHMSRRKEPRYFCKDIVAFKDGWRVDTLEAYLNLFSAAQNHTYIGEASPFYLQSDVALQEIFDFNPRSQILILLRNPVEAIISRFRFNIQDGLEDLSSLQEALDAEPSRRRGENIPPGASNNFDFFYKETYQYSTQIRRAYSVFPSSQIHILFFDDLRTSTSSFYSSILSLLDLDHNIDPDFKTHRKYEDLRSIDALLRKQLREHPRLRRSVVKMVPRETKARISRFLSKIRFPTIRQPYISQSLIEELHEEFAAEVDAVSEITGRDLEQWKYYKNNCHYKK